MTEISTASPPIQLSSAPSFYISYALGVLVVGLFVALLWRDRSWRAAAQKMQAEIRDLRSELKDLRISDEETPIFPGIREMQAADAMKRGHAHVTLKNYHAAVKEYTRAILFDPADPSAYAFRAVAWTELKADLKASQDNQEAHRLSRRLGLTTAHTASTIP